MDVAPVGTGTMAPHHVADPQVQDVRPVMPDEYDWSGRTRRPSHPVAARFAQTCPTPFRERPLRGSALRRSLASPYAAPAEAAANYWDRSQSFPAREGPPVRRVSGPAG